jgi:hypothetical protein
MKIERPFQIVSVPQHRHSTDTHYYADPGILMQIQTIDYNICLFNLLHQVHSFAGETNNYLPTYLQYYESG